MSATEANVPATAYLVVPARRCLAKVASAALGYTPKAMDRKREEGYWLKGVHWFRAPDGRIHYDIEAIEKWVSQG
jgi:hypothetical protein